MVEYCPFCNLTTGGEHEEHCPLRSTVQRNSVPLGWICPVCGRGNSPFTPTCPCILNPRTETKYGDGTFPEVTTTYCLSGENNGIDVIG
jgi:rubredoxin